MKILFISHSYPPIMGGVESQNYNLSQGLKKIAQTTVIANGKGKIWLPFFLPLAFFKALLLMRDHDACLLGNGVLAPLGAVLRWFYPQKKFFCVIHGLDITYAHRNGFLPNVYRLINIPSINRQDKLFMVGQSTIDEALKVNIDREKCVLIPNGVYVEDFRQPHTREELSALFGKNVASKKVIFRLGRFVPHKGTSWFIDKVIPKLPQEVVMVATGLRVGKNTAGDPDDYLNCEKAIMENKLEDRVKLLPSLPQKDLLVLLNTVDIVISPNIKVPGSMEGFGINAIEAGACERLVVASNLEGLATAIQDGKNGFLVEQGNVEAWVKKLTSIINQGDTFIQQFGQRAGQYVQDNFAWDKICQRYLEEMEKIE